MRGYTLFILWMASVVASSGSARPTTQSTLRAVDAQYGVHVARIEIHTTITTDGKLRRVTNTNVTYGPADKGGPPHIEIREGNLSLGQVAELSRAFADWEKLKNAYGGVPDGPEFRIRYGDTLIVGGSDAPQQVFKVDRMLNDFGLSMPLKNP